MTTAHESAQIALGKFYLHRWEGQVLVDWASSMLSQEVDDEPIRKLAEMEGAERTAQLDQFIYACGAADIVVYENMELSIRAYVQDLRRRALAEEIEFQAAFAQLRPLAYDNTSVVIPGLSELDEDFNLLDSSQPAFHNEEMTLANRDEHLKAFFAGLSVEEGPWDEPVRDKREVYEGPLSRDFASYAEAVAVVTVLVFIVLYLLLMFSSFMASAISTPLYSGMNCLVG